MIDLTMHKNLIFFCGLIFIALSFLIIIIYSLCARKRGKSVISILLFIYTLFCFIFLLGMEVCRMSEIYPHKIFKAVFTRIDEFWMIKLIYYLIYVLVVISLITIAIKLENVKQNKFPPISRDEIGRAHV